MNKLMLAAMAVALIVPAVASHGWVVTQTEPAPGSGLAEAVVLPFDWDPGRDLFEIHKYFLVDQQPLVLKFTREAGDMDTVEIVDEIILNMLTPEQQAWLDYHVELLVDPFDGKLVNFIDPHLARAWKQTGGDTRLDGVPLTSGPTGISWETTDPGQAVPYGTFGDAPTNQLVLRDLVIDTSNVGVGESFLFKQWPTVPEPGTLALLTVAGALRIMRRRRRG